MDKIESRNRFILLYSIYKNLLSDTQNKYLYEYLEKDKGFSEIALIYNVSRQAVFDSINKTYQYLENVEAKLHFYNKINNVMNYLNNLKLDYKNIDDIRLIMLEER